MRPDGKPILISDSWEENPRGYPGAFRRKNNLDGSGKDLGMKRLALALGLSDRQFAADWAGSNFGRKSD